MEHLQVAVAFIKTHVAHDAVLYTFAGALAMTGIHRARQEVHRNPSKHVLCDTDIIPWLFSALMIALYAIMG